MLIKIKKIRYIVLFAFLAILFFGSSFVYSEKQESINNEFQFQEFLSPINQNDVILFFNSGGWGDTLPEQAEDFYSIIKGTKEVLKSQGYNLIVVPYKRTENTFLGRIIGIKDFFNSFNESSQELVKEIEFLRKDFPNTKIMIAGLSIGGSFSQEVMETISKKSIDSVYAITAGIPFWSEKSDLENMLSLDNKGEDSLVEGDFLSLITTLIKAPFKCVFSKIYGESSTLAQSFFIPNHQYFWSSFETAEQISLFLENKFSSI